MNLQELSQRAHEVRQKYNELNEKENGGAWGQSEIMSGFIGDIGDLTKLVMAKEGLRKIDNHDEKLKHELADCLWSLLVLAKGYDINLEQEFLKTMNELDERVDKLLSK